MDIQVSFPGGKRVDALVDGRVVSTDQPLELGGDGAAPAPFDLFLASLGTCAGIYVLGFCQARGISMEGVSLVQRVEVDVAEGSPTKGLPTKVRIELRLPPSFPEKYVAAVTRAAEGCKVKRVIAASPAFEVTAIRDERGGDDVPTSHVPAM